MVVPVYNKFVVGVVGVTLSITVPSTLFTYPCSVWGAVSCVSGTVPILVVFTIVVVVVVF